MVSLNALPRIIRARKFYLFFWVFFASDSIAQERSITKIKAPNPILVLSNSDTVAGVGFARLHVFTADIPAAIFADSKQLMEIQWSTTYYPQGFGEEVKLCYIRPYSTEESCRAIYPNSSGTLFDFNAQAFDHGAYVTIYHRVYGGTPRYIQPAGVDSVTFRYR